MERNLQEDAAKHVERGAQPLDDEEMEKLVACAEAIHYIAGRIRDDEKVRYLMGYGTQTLTLLAHALGALCGVSDERAQAYILGERDEI